MTTDPDQPTLPPAPKWKTILAALFAILLGCLAPLVVAEIGIRLVAPQNTIYFDDSDLRKNYWEFRPGTSHPAYIGVPVHINNVGMRGADIVQPKPAGTFRILTVGDSITFGYGMPNENTFPKVLEDRLNANPPGGLHYEVLNAGVPATGLDYYEYFVRNRAATLQPDLILICLAMNDIADYTGRPTTPPPTNKKRFDYPLMRYSHLYNFFYVKAKSILYSLRILKLEKMADSDFLPVQGPSADLDQAFTSTRAMLDRVVDASRQLTPKTAVVLFPLEPQLSPALLDLYRREYKMKIADAALEGEPQKQLAAFAQSKQMVFVDLLPVFRQAKEGALYLRNASISYDPAHPSVLGHRVAAEGILQAIQPLLPTGR